MKICAEIKGIKYKPFLCKHLNVYNIDELEKALSERASFILTIDCKNKIAVSRWVSPKRTRSYPYARVYDTLSFTGKKVTIIPIMKDEGRGENKKGCKGDRDFLQWDTISLMSLLGIYVIIAYYVKAERKNGCRNRITNQKFDVNYIKKEILNLQSYQSDALHWNLEQIGKIGQIAESSFSAYKRISEEMGIEMHSMESARKRIEELKKGREKFMELSRGLSRKAQKRESITRQPKEKLEGSKGTITIKNYLGGEYYFTCDEVEKHCFNLYLIEGKHTRKGALPSEEDIKDGLIKMILFVNLKNVKVDNKKYRAVPILKLTTARNELNTSKLELLIKEAKFNGFKIKINDKFIV